VEAEIGGDLSRLRISSEQTGPPAPAHDNQPGQQLLRGRLSATLEGGDQPLGE
jgi:hypothetical protein